MPALLLLLLAVFVAGPGYAASSIEATIAGTTAAVEADLLRRDDAGDWQKVAHTDVPATARKIRFETLSPGVYQLRIRGERATEQLATKVVVGSNDERLLTIAIEPVELTGRITIGGTDLGEGVIVLQHKELGWSAPIALDGKGRFHVPLWQTGEYAYRVRGAALATMYVDTVQLKGKSPIEFAVDIPDGRITGIVRDAKSGAPVANALVLLQTNAADNEQHVRTSTTADGRFDFPGMKDGRHIVRIVPPLHLQPRPIEFELGPAKRLHEIDARVDPGRTIPIVVADADADPVANAVVFAISGTRLSARATTDEDGRASIAIPAEGDTTLFVVPAEGAFGALRVPSKPAADRLRVDLPRASSSLSIRTETTSGASLPDVSMLMRYDGTLVPSEVAAALAATLGLRLATGTSGEMQLRNIPAGNYEFWPYRTLDEAAAIVATADAVAAPIQVEVRNGANNIAVQFAAR